MIQDPHFWKRFSTAVHQDEAIKEEMAGSPDLKHSYVPSISSAPMSPDFPPSAAPSMHNLLAQPAPVALRKEEIWQREFESEKQALAQHTQRPCKKPSKLKKSASRASTRPLLHKQQQPSLTFSLRRPSIPGLRSPSCLSLSGRPKTVFKTWTTCEANPIHSTSWLESQNKKSRHRTWMCWAFWLSMIVLVAGVVVTVLVLRAHGII
jgi:hypothetical protein